MSSDPLERRWRPPFPVDPWLTLAPLCHGPGDPTIRLGRDGVWRASRGRTGAATIQLRFQAGEVHAVAWGPGAQEALDGVPRLLGADDDPDAFQPRAGILRDLAARRRGLRMTRTDWALGSLVPAVIEQKVTGDEAQRSYRRLIRLHGERAPGPAGLWLPPPAERLAAMPYWAYHPVGLEQRRADAIRRAAAKGAWVEAAGALAPPDALARLQVLPGIGPWTAAETARTAWGDPDAVSMGDYHLPSLVAWVLAGEPRADDARMLELLEPWRGQRARVARLLELSGRMPPRHGPRMASRSIAGL